MSSTGRSDVRQEDDHYQTPAWAIRAVLPHLPPLAGKRILEPSAGRGAIVRELIAAGADPKLITVVEPNAGRCDVLRALGVDPFRGTFEEFVEHTEIEDSVFDLVPMNPPFIHAEEHIRLARKVLAPGGTVAALCRLAFLAESQCRASFRKDHPHDRVELVRRPSFTAEMVPRLSEEELAAMAKTITKKGKEPRLETVAEVRSRLTRTDSCAYAWGLFGDGRGGRFVTHEEQVEARDSEAA